MLQAAGFSHGTNSSVPPIQRLRSSQQPTLGTGDVHMSDELRSADDEEGSTSQQAPAKRKRCMGRGDPHDQTHDAAVGAMHAARAEPAGSAAQISQPAAAGKRCACFQETH